MERKRVNWTQELRKANLQHVADLMQKEGGYSLIMMANEMPDFEGFVSVELGCSIRQAKDYIDTLRRAAIFYQKSQDRQKKRGDNDV